MEQRTSTRGSLRAIPQCAGMELFVLTATQRLDLAQRSLPADCLFRYTAENNMIQALKEGDDGRTCAFGSWQPADCLASVSKLGAAFLRSWACLIGIAGSPSPSRPVSILVTISTDASMKSETAVGARQRLVALIQRSSAFRKHPAFSIAGRPAAPVRDSRDSLKLATLCSLMLTRIPAGLRIRSHARSSTSR